MPTPTKEELQRLLDALDANEAKAKVMVADRVARLQSSMTRDDLNREWASMRAELPLSDVMDVVDAYAPGKTPCAYSWDDALRRLFEKWSGK